MDCASATKNPVKFTRPMAQRGLRPCAANDDHAHHRQLHCDDWSNGVGRRLSQRTDSDDTVYDTRN
jgi:hypothetical protein